MNLKLFLAVLFKEITLANISIAQQPNVQGDLWGGEVPVWVKILLFLECRLDSAFLCFKNRPSLQATLLFVCRRYVYKQICGCLYIMEQFQWERWMNENI